MFCIFFLRICSSYFLHFVFLVSSLTVHNLYTEQYLNVNYIMEQTPIYVYS